MARSNGSAIGGFVCGIIGALTSVFFGVLVFPGILGAVGIYLGNKGRKMAAQGAQHGGLATAGLILGIIAVAVTLLWWALVVVGVTSND